MNGKRTLRWAAAWGLVSALALGGCLIPKGVFAAEKVTFTSGWIFYGRDMAWFTAKDKGYFAEEGVDINLVRGFGGGDAAKRLIGGTLDIAALDTSNLITLRAKGETFKSIGMWFDRPPFAIVTLGNSPIKSLKDLEGRSIGTPSADSSWMTFPVVAKMNGIDLGKIKHIEVSPAVRDSGLLAGNYDASTNYVTSLPLVFRAAAKQGKKIRYFLFAKHGLDIYAQGLVTSEKNLRERPNTIRGFLKAAMRGAAYAMEHPEEATDILLKNVPAADRETNRQTWDLTIDLWLTPDAERLGIGWMTEEKWARTRDIMTKAMNLSAQLPTKDLYTNEFLPKIFPKRGPRVFPTIF